MRGDQFLLTTGLLASALLSWNLLAGGNEDGFVSIFDGKTLKGWHISSASGHSRASGNKTGGKWVIAEETILGCQDIPGNGGILVTDEKFGDFEVVLEMKNDFGPDSGLFLRSTENGTAYQAMIDYHANGNLMGIYGEGMGGKPHLRNFSFLASPDQIRQEPEAGFPLPILVDSWDKFWRHDQWNELRARIVGELPKITTWINGVKIMEWKESEKRHPVKGGIALQVHGGGDSTKEYVRYRKIRVKRLD